MLDHVLVTAIPVIRVSFPVDELQIKIRTLHTKVFFMTSTRMSVFLQMHSTEIWVLMAVNIKTVDFRVITLYSSSYFVAFYCVNHYR
jgi:hypothetical protein